MNDKDIRELSDEELKAVNGGSSSESGPNSIKCCGWTFSGALSKYAENHKGENLYFVSEDADEYYYGCLLDSFESEYTFWTYRKQAVQCIEHNGAPFTGFVQLPGDDFYIYTARNK